MALDETFLCHFLQQWQEVHYYIPSKTNSWCYCIVVCQEDYCNNGCCRRLIIDHDHMPSRHNDFILNDPLLKIIGRNYFMIDTFSIPHLLSHAIAQGAFSKYFLVNFLEALGCWLLMTTKVAISPIKIILLSLYYLFVILLSLTSGHVTKDMG